MQNRAKHLSTRSHCPLFVSGWNRRSTSLAAATRPCPTSSKATATAAHALSVESSALPVAVRCGTGATAARPMPHRGLTAHWHWQLWLSFSSVERFLPGVYTTKESNHGKPVYKKASFSGAVFFDLDRLDTLWTSVAQDYGIACDRIYRIVVT